MKTSPATAPTPPSPATRGGKRAWLIAGLLVLAAGAAYFNALSTPFIFDDRPAVERNESIRQLWPLTSALNPPETAAGAAGRPVINLSLALNYAVGGLDPRGYHAVNLAIHALAGLALWGVLRRALRRVAPDPAAESAAALAALLWVAHPLQTESVVCIAQRSESLAGLIYLGTFYCFARATEPNAARGWSIATVLSCLVGMAAKETMATAPLLLFLYDRAFVAGTFRAAWARRGKLYIALAATWILLVWLMLRSNQRAGTVGFGLGLSSYDYLLTQCQALATYLKLTLWPAPLIVDYGLPVATRLGAVWPQGLLVIALLAVTVITLRRGPAVGFAGAWFFVILAPSSSFVPLTTQTIAEHRMYLPLAAVTVLAALGLQRLNRPLRWITAVALCTAALAVTMQRNRDYRSELSIWTDTVAKAPQNPRAHASLAGAFAKVERWEDAARSYETALALRPDYADAQSDYAGVLGRMGSFPAAIPHYEIAVRLKPNDPDIRYNLGVAFTETRQWSKAITAYEAVVRRVPRHALALANLGDALLQSGRADEALARFESVVALTPRSAAAHQNVAAALVALRRWPEARTHYVRAVELAPDDATLRVTLGDALLRAHEPAEAATHYEVAARLRPELPELHYNLGNLRLQLEQSSAAAVAYETALRLRPAWPEAHHNLALALVKLRRPAEAIPHYETVLATMPRSATVHHNLAVALALAGRLAEAIRHDEIALELQPGYREAQAHLRFLRQR